MKTYSAKTNALAADAVLTAAVEEAVVLYGRPHPWVEQAAAELLLAAAQSAELLLERAR